MKKSKYKQLLHCFNKKVKVFYINEQTIVERELKIPTVKENDNFIDSVIFAQVAISDLKKMFPQEHIDISNIFIFDKDQKLVRVQSKEMKEDNNGEESEQDGMGRQEIYNSVNRYTNIKMERKGEPFTLYFAQRMEEKKYKDTMSSEKTLNDKNKTKQNNQQH